jgi:hypothetical protein
MTLALLLLLAGPFATDEPQARPVGDGPGARPEATAQAGGSGQLFKVAPLQLALAGIRGPKGPFQLAQAPRLAANSRPAMVQLQNRRSGVTCTMLIVRVEPSVDPGILAHTLEAPADPMVRNDLSPCVEQDPDRGTRR